MKWAYLFFLLTYSQSVPENDDIDESSMRQKEWREMGLVRSGRLFGGLIDDVKRKAPFYLCDFKDGVAIQSLAAFFFM